MCGAFNLEHDIINYLKSYGLSFQNDNLDDFKGGDFFPNGNSLILRGKKVPKAESMRWYYSYGDGKTNVFNCRSESIFEKSMFKSSIRYRRCVIPVSFYYEWTGDKGKKSKLIISDFDDKPIFLGGIFDIFNVKGQMVEGFSVITRESIGEVSNYHHRMPVILDIDNITPWLNKDTELEYVKKMISLDRFLKVKLP